MGRYRYRSTEEELSALKQAVLDVVGAEPLDRRAICKALMAAAPGLAEAPFWEEKVSTACQQLRKEDLLTSVRLPGGRGRAWRGWKRV